MSIVLTTKTDKIHVPDQAPVSDSLKILLDEQSTLGKAGASEKVGESCRGLPPRRLRPPCRQECRVLGWDAGKFPCDRNLNGMKTTTWGKVR